MWAPYYISLFRLSLNCRFSLKNVFPYLENHCTYELIRQSSFFYVEKSLPQNKYFQYSALSVLAKRSHYLHLSSVIVRKQKMCRRNDFSNLFSLICGELKSRIRKKSWEPFLRKFDFKFPPYLTMARNWSKSLKKVCERGLGLKNDTNNFSSPYHI